MVRSKKKKKPITVVINCEEIGRIKISEMSGYRFGYKPTRRYPKKRDVNSTCSQIVVFDYTTEKLNFYWEI